MNRLLAAVLVTCALTASCSRTGAGASGPPPTEDARPGGTLTVGIGEPVTLDPALVEDASARLVLSTMCTPLVRPGSEAAPVPVAASEFNVGGSGRELTLTVRSGLRAGDGSKLDARDVSAWMARLASDTLASPAAELISSVEGYDLIHKGHSAKKIGERADDAPATDRLDGVETLGARALRIRLAVPNTEFVATLASPALALVPRSAWRDRPDGELAGRPQCAGPYRMAAPWHPGGAEIRLERNPYYRPVDGTHTRGGRGWADRIVFRVQADPAARLQAYRRGETDMAFVDGADAASLAPVGDQLVHAPTGETDYVGLSSASALLRDVHVDPAMVHAAAADIEKSITDTILRRQLEQALPAALPTELARGVLRQALSLAIDRTALVASVYGGRRLPATDVLPATVPAAEHAPRCGATNEHGDAADARRLAGLLNPPVSGRNLTLAFNDEGQHRAVAQSIAAAWKSVLGIDVTLVPMTWGDYEAKGRVGGFDGAFRVSWAGPASGVDQLGQLLGGRANWAGAPDPIVAVALGDRIAGDRNPERRAATLREFQTAYLCRVMPLLPISNGQTSAVVRRAAVGTAHGSAVDLVETFVKTR